MAQTILEVPAVEFDMGERLTPAPLELLETMATTEALQELNATQAAGALATRQYLPTAEKAGSGGNGGSGSSGGDKRGPSRDEVEETTWNEGVTDDKGGKLPKREPGESGHK